MKKILAILLTLLLIPSMTAFAEDVTVTIPAFQVTFNGTVVESGSRQYPLICYREITYVPMTYYDCRYLGLSTDWNSETNTLTLEKSRINCAFRDYAWAWENSQSGRASVCDFNIVVDGKHIDNAKEDYPLLTFRDVTYFPLTWRFAVEEFGWDYSFDSENGLCITSDNMHAKTVKLPNLTGSVAADGSYYYYNGKDGDRHVVYRAAADDTDNPEIIFECPDTPLSHGVTFLESEGDVYFTYVAGSSPTMSSKHVRKIQKDGTVTEETPAYYSDSSHGSSVCYARKNGIDVKAVNPTFDSRTEFSYTIDGVTKDMAPFPGRVRLGERRNGQTSQAASMEDSIQIYGDCIYFTGIDLDTEEDSALYVIDTKTGTAERLIDGVSGFHVYNGWVRALSQDSAMILYDEGGRLMRYTVLTGVTQPIEREGEQDLVLRAAAGGQTIYTVQQTADGKRTVVKVFDDYASGAGSIHGTLLKTTMGARWVKSAGMLCVYTLGESPEDEARIVASRWCTSSDVAESVYIYEDVLIYKLAGEETVVQIPIRY